MKYILHRNLSQMNTNMCNMTVQLTPFKTCGSTSTSCRCSTRYLIIICNVNISFKNFLNEKACREYKANFGNISFYMQFKKYGMTFSTFRWLYIYISRRIWISIACKSKLVYNNLKGLL